MADLVWTEDPAIRPGEREKTGDGVRLSPVTGVAVMQVIARRDRDSRAAAALDGVLAIRAPRTAQIVIDRKLSVLWSGPGQWLVIAPEETAATLAKDIRSAMAGIAGVADQSHGRLLIRLSGREARRVLAKVSSLDYHDSVFPAGSTALTAMDHVAVQIWREADADNAPSFVIAVVPSLAKSLWHALTGAAAEFGLAAD